MSVLFKALARAAKARESLAPSAALSGHPLPLSGGRSRRRLLPLFLGAFAAALVVGLGVTFFLDDGSSRPAAPRPVPQLHVGPKLPGATPNPAPAASPVVAPAPSPIAANSPVVPPPPGVDTTVAATPAVAPTAPVTTPAPPMAVVAANGAPAASVAPPPPAVKSLAAKPPTVVDEDLPAILEHIRRGKTASVMSGPVAVDRAGASAAASGMSVTVSDSSERDTAVTAYDLLVHGQYDEALRVYQKALKISPANVSLLLGKATAEQKLQRLNEARDSYRQVLAHDPENREALTNMTVLVAAQAPDQALAELRVLQNKNPAFSPVPAQIASLEAERGDLAAAIAAMGMAVQISPENGLYRLNLAILQDRAGMTGDAATSYQTAIDLLGTDSNLPLPLEQIRSRLHFLQGR